MRPPEPQKADRTSARKPAAFRIEEEEAETPAIAPPPLRRSPQSFDEAVVMTPDELDPFLSEKAPDEAASLVVPEPRRKRFSFGKLAAGAFGILLSLALGLWTDQLIRDLFSRADWLGYTAIGAVAIGILAVLALAGRELAGLFRLAAVQSLKTDAEAARLAGGPKPARAVIDRLLALLSSRAETAKGRATLKATEGEIIDAPHLIDLAERELLAPLDRQARALILGASKRVSVVTAVSPRAIVDLLYVLFEAVRLGRNMAGPYRGPPGAPRPMRPCGDGRRLRAVPGPAAVGDSRVEQVLGHGRASKRSARLGEGVVNGLMTARIGIAAMDLCRPLAFRALKRPGIGDFMGDLAPSFSGGAK